MALHWACMLRNSTDSALMKKRAWLRWVYGTQILDPPCTELGLVTDHYSYKNVPHVFESVSLPVRRQAWRLHAKFT